MTTVALSQRERVAVDLLVADLQRVFGPRLQSVVAYGAAALTDDDSQPLHALALVDSLGFADLAACAPLMDGWIGRGLATPLLLSREEFMRTLDVFPVEYGTIISNHVLVFGSDPFAGCVVCEADLRRAVELQAKSHLIHLRQGYLEASGRPDRISRLMVASLPAYRSLLDNLARLHREPGDGHDSSRPLLNEIAAGSTIADPSALLQRYISDIERIWAQVDMWRSETRN